MHSAGGKTTWPLLPGVTGNAKFSRPDRKYRHWLTRKVGPQTEKWTRGILYIGMNPSTAEATIDDPTIRKEQHYMLREGFDFMVKCNVMDYRCTDSDQLLVRHKANVRLCSPKNLEWIRWWADRVDTIVFAWGKLPKQLEGHAQNVKDMLRWHNPLCLGKNADGSPKHPLYLPNSAPLITFYGGNYDQGRVGDTDPQPQAE